MLSILLALADLPVDSNTATALVGTTAGAGLIVVLAGVWKIVVGPELDKRRASEEVRLTKSVEIEREQTKQTENLKTAASNFQSLAERLAELVKDHERRP